MPVAPEPTPAIDADVRAALSDLVGRYASAVDRREFERLRAVFTADAVLDTGRGMRAGIDEIVATMERLRRYEATFHLLGQQSLEPASGGAIDGETYCDAHHLLADDAGRTDTVMKIRYADRFVDTDSGWRIIRRVLHIDWTETRPLTTRS